VDLEALAAAKGPVALEPIPAEAAWGPAPLGGPWDWSALMGAGGAATAVALLAWAEQQHPGAPCFALAVGPAVRAGLPTAARAHVAARAPLTGRLSEGLVGGELGLRLASFADGLLLTGRIPARDRVLRLLAPADGAGPRAVLAELPVRDGSRTSDILDAARSLAGPGALLAAGPAADRGVRFANLANESDPPSFVGRGGLGLALAELGVKAVHVGAEPVAAAGDPEWTTRLARSPRLIQRGAQGSIELFEALAARGVAASVGAARDDMQRHRGCRGCPTPCGWVFERGERPAAGAHFAALAPFGELLDLREREEQRAVLEACDRVGVDAKESARVLRALGIVGDASACVSEIERWGRASAEELAGVARGADALANARGVPLPDLSARAEPIQRLAVRTSGGASDPMRSFPFLVDGTANALALGLLSSWGFEPSALDPSSFEAKPQLLAWHERVVAAVDTAGFCAFSAGALLADGLATLDELIARLFDCRTAGPRNAAEGLALGDAVCRARGLLDTGREPLPGDDPELEAAWMAYGAWCASGALLEGGAQPVRADAAEQSSALPESVPGRLRVHSSGPLGVALGELEALDLPLPATLDDVLAELVRRRPAARPFLAGAGGSAAAAHVSRAGRSRRLVPGEPLLDGDELWLVVALPGG
jgi:aldehyde:ferredoxin oxidoreductase